MQDFAIVNARVCDGSGTEAFRGSVRIADGRISEVSSSNLAGARVLDVKGSVLAPGFIDLHTHSDFSLPVYPEASAMVRQGVTTQVVGNCGFSPFPAPPHRQQELRAMTSFLDAGLNWGAWHDAASFFRYLEESQPSCNVAALVGHGVVRTAVMGSDDRAPTEAELDRMRDHVSEAMAAGAFGMSSGLTYAPGIYAESDEIHALAALVANRGGFYASHMRNESARLVEALEELLEVGRATGIPIEISHLKALGRAHWELIDVALERLDDAISAGADVIADQYPYTAGSTSLSVLLPPWVLALGADGVRGTLRDPLQRKLIASQIRDQDESQVALGLREFEPENVRLAQVPSSLDQAWQGLSISQIAAKRREDPVDTLLHLLEVGGVGVLTTVHTLSEDRVRQVMQHPAVAVASDGWTLDPCEGGRPHPRSYGTFARVLGRYVREDRVLTLEDAVRKMTSLPARRLPGLDVGLIRPGSRADLVIFDPEAVTDQATFQDPHQFATGVDYVVVGGQVVVDGGQQTTSRPGVVLRREP